MGRAKIAMEPINNHKKRKLTFNTRKQGLIKKATKLSTLCDVNVSSIICTDDQQNPQIHPPDFHKLHILIDLYKHNRCTYTGRVNFYGLSDYYIDRKMKIEEEVAKAKKKNLEAKYPLWFNFLDKFSETDLREFGLGLRRKIINKGVDPVGFYGVHDNLIMQSSNPNSLVNMMLNEVDDDVVCDGGSFWAQPPLMEDCFSTNQFLKQFLVPDFPSQVENTAMFNYLL
ncbi:hypothetical protein L1987_50813 [Smallanthus sonchifolius]|uniref:Uncharacterized protein n=1 Tax=Smallanthus sonchifolius TaxID=185202 RepID=A0ACB9EMY4_9ASTR|nr:hypothetical protein L1987_50813 [Smallanthus sonchifolius]